MEPGACRYISLSTPEEVDAFAKEFEMWDSDALKVMLRHDGLALIMLDDDFKFPGSYLAALRSIANKKEMNLYQYIFQILVKDVEKNVTSEIKKRCKVVPLTKQDKKYFMEVLSHQSDNSGLVGLSTYNKEYGDIHIVLKKDEAEFIKEHNQEGNPMSKYPLKRLEPKLLQKTSKAKSRSLGR